jgi:predicted transcriptional regulator
MVKDEIDEILPETNDACEVRTPGEHAEMFKVLENPIRRKIIERIGVFGVTREELKSELNLSEMQLKFNMDMLIKDCYAEIDGDKYRLTEKGIGLLEGMKRK